MSLDDSFGALMNRLRAGEEVAAAELFQRFARRLIGLARTRLDALMRQKMDPEDVMQSVFKSFFRRHREGNWDLADWDSLWSLLARITIRKCARRAAHYHGQRRDVRRETAPATDQQDSAFFLQAINRGPTPDEAAMLAECIEQLLGELEGYHRDIAQLSLQGCTSAEIAAETGVSERSVQRVLKWMRGRIEKLADA
jgi:RNA polymerase sigma-70 factor (ECF subfamily)